MAPGVVPAAMAPGVLPATNPANAPATAPAIATPPVQLPPLGRNLELPPGVIPGQTTASGAYISNGNPAIPPRMQMALPVCAGSVVGAYESTGTKSAADFQPAAKQFY